MLGESYHFALVPSKQIVSESIKRAIDSLSLSKQEDLLFYLSTRIRGARQSEPAQKLSCEGEWATEDKSDLQYWIPEI